MKTSYKSHVSLIVIILAAILLPVIISPMHSYAAANQSELQSFLNQINVPQQLDDTNNPSPIKVNTDDVQNYFSLVGDASANYNNGAWNTISLTSDSAGQVGGISLNMPIDMSHDFHFKWQYEVYTQNDAQMADGMGIALHPMYTPGRDTTIIDNRTGANRSFTGKVAQGLNSFGEGGGDLGIADMMNVVGFKFDSYPYDRGGTPISNTFFGDSSHFSGSNNPATGIIYGQADNLAAPISYIDTDSTGYMYFPTTNVTATPYSSTAFPLLGPNDRGNYGVWWNVSMDYTVKTHTFDVTITNAANSAQSMSFTRTLSGGVLANIQAKPDWAFELLASTAMIYSANVIQNFSGSFTPEKTIIVRKVDANGNDLKAPTSTTLSDWNLDNPNSLNTFSNTNTDMTINHNNQTYTLFQLNRIGYDANGNITTPRRLYTKPGANPPLGTTLTSTASSWTVTYPYTDTSSVVYLVYVYRENVTNMSPPALTANKTTVSPGDTVTFTCSVTNTAGVGPSSWLNVTGAMALPKTFSYNSGGTNVTQVSGTANSQSQPILQFPLNTSAGTNNLNSGDTGTNSFTLTYNGASTMNIHTNDYGITFTSDGAATTNKFYVYDSSSQTSWDVNGNPTFGSYFLNTNTPDAPLATTSTPPFNIGSMSNGTKKFVPVSNSVSSSEAFQYTSAFSYTNVDNGTSIFTNPNHPNNTTQGAYNAAISEDLPAGTATVGSQTYNQGAPAPKIAGYTYLGYTYNDGSGAKWVAYDPKTPTSSVFTNTYGTYSLTTTIQYDYCPNSDLKSGLALTAPNIDFGTQKAIPGTYGTSANTSLQVTDSAPSIAGLGTNPFSPNIGAWQLSVSSNQALINTADSAKTLPNCYITFDQATIANDNIHQNSATTQLDLNNTNQLIPLVYSDQFDSGNITWNPGNIQLTVPKDSAVGIGTYQTQLNWQVTRSIE